MLQDFLRDSVNVSEEEILRIMSSFSGFNSLLVMGSRYNAVGGGFYFLVNGKNT